VGKLERKKIATVFMGVVLLVLSITLFFHAKGYMETHITAAGIEIGLAVFVFLFSISRLEKILRS